MKRLLPLIALLFLTACATNRVVYNTLAGIKVTTDSAVSGYYDLVVHGQAKTNGVPAVSQAYNAFETTWTLAVQVASFNTNAPVPQVVSDASVKVLTTIATAKGQ